MTKEELRSNWKARVNEYKKSGESKSKWCRDNNINLKSFCNWYSKFDKQEAKKIENNKTTGWLSINIKDDPINTIIPKDEAPENISIGSASINDKTNNNLFEKSNIVVRIGKASIEVSDGFDKKLLFDVAKTLGELC